MDFLEGVLSVIVGIVGGIIAGVGVVIGFTVGAVFRILRYLIGDLIGLFVPSLKYKIKLKRMLRHADDGKDAKLHTGVFGKYEMKGSEFDALFSGMKACIETFGKQKDQRGAVLNRHPELAPVFAQYDQLFGAFQKQFYLSAETVKWKTVDVYNYNGILAFPVLKKAYEGMKTLTERQQAVLNGAVADEVSELELIQNMTEEIMLADPPEQTQQMQ